MKGVKFIYINRLSQFFYETDAAWPFKQKFFPKIAFRGHFQMNVTPSL